MQSVVARPHHCSKWSHNALWCARKRTACKYASGFAVQISISVRLTTVLGFIAFGVPCWWSQCTGFKIKIDAGAPTLYAYENNLWGRAASCWAWKRDLGSLHCPRILTVGSQVPPHHAGTASISASPLPILWLGCRRLQHECKSVSLYCSVRGSLLSCVKIFWNVNEVGKFLEWKTKCTDAYNG